MITKLIDPFAAFGDVGSVVTHSTPKGNNVIGSHSFLEVGRVVVVVVVVGGGGNPGVLVGVGVGVLVRLTVGVKLGVGDGVAVLDGVGVGVGHAFSLKQLVQS